MTGAIPPTAVESSRSSLLPIKLLGNSTAKADKPARAGMGNGQPHLALL